MSADLRTLLTSVEAPDETLVRRFLLARDLVRSSSGETVPDGLRVPALLAIGDHGTALDRLRALRPLSGAQSELLLHYAAWTGDQRWLAQFNADGQRDIAGTPLPPSKGAARALELWRDSDATSAPHLAAELVSGAIVSVWGIVPNGAGQSVAIEPTFPDDWRSMAVRNLRIGETVLDLALRRTRNGTALAVSRTRGPAIRVALTMAGVGEFHVDGERLAGGRAVFRVESESVVTMHR